MSTSSEQTLKSDLSISSDYNHSSEYNQFYYAPSTPTTSPTSPNVNTISPELLFNSSSYGLEPFSSSFSFPNSASPSPIHDGHGSFSFSLQDVRKHSFDYDHFYPQSLISKPICSTFSPYPLEALATNNNSSHFSHDEYRPSSSSGSVCDDNSSYKSGTSPSRRGSRQQGSALDRLPHIVSSDEKVHKCTEILPDGTNCQRRFKRQEHLKRHLKTHTPALRPFRCPVATCKAFSRRDNLKQHWKTHSRKNGRNQYIPNLPESPDDYVDPMFPHVHTQCL